MYMSLLLITWLRGGLRHVIPNYKYSFRTMYGTSVYIICSFLFTYIFKYQVPRRWVFYYSTWKLRVEVPRVALISTWLKPSSKLSAKYVLLILFPRLYYSFFLLLASVERRVIQTSYAL